MELHIDDHPLLDAVVFVTEFARPLGEIETPTRILELFALDAVAPVQRSDDIRAASRNILRHGGYKPTGRGKPASEYLVKASESGTLESINPAVDVLNAVSLHSGIPISVVDLNLASEPFRIGIAGDDASYVFNPSGQEIGLKGLLSLHDAQGPCANGVKDCQRTKTNAETTHTLSVIWGTNALDGYSRAVFDWYRDLLVECGATVNQVHTS